jgi:hypothetical protein
MAYKYEQSSKDRKDESRGMKKAMKKRSGGNRRFVEGCDPMVGRNSFAGMPEEKVVAEYPKPRMRKGGYIDDTMVDIDDLQMESTRTVDKNISYQK